MALRSNSAPGRRTRVAAALAACLALIPPPAAAADATTGFRRLSGLLGLWPQAPDAHRKFLQEVRRESPARLVEAASRALAAGDVKLAGATAGRASAILSNPFDMSLPLAVRLRLWATSALYTGQSLSALADAPGARAAFRDVAVLTDAMLRLDPNDRSAKQLAVAGAINVAAVDLGTGQPDAAIAHYRRAKTLLEALAAADDSDRETQQTLASADRAIGELKLRAGDVGAAIASLQLAEMREALLLTRNPQDADARLGLARSSITIGDASLAKNDLNAAQAAYSQAQLRLAEGDALAAAATVPWRYAVAESRAGLASVAEGRGDLRAAAEGYRGARDDFLSLVPVAGTSDPLRALGSTTFHLANVLAQLKDTAGATDALRDAIDAFTGLLTRNAGDVDAQRRLFATFGRLAELQIGAGDANAAIGSFGEARDILGRLLALQPGNGPLRRDRAICDYQIGKLLAGKRDFSGAAEALRASLKELRTLLAAAPGDLELRRSTWTVSGSLGALLEGRGDLQGALAAYRGGAKAMTGTASAGAAKTIPDASTAQALTVSAERISSVGYMLLLAHDFAGALKAEDDALVLTPGTPWIEANRAHALMLLGRTEEARAIYLRYRGEKFPGNVPWANGTHADFVEMRKAGISSGLMDEVEKALGAPK